MFCGTLILGCMTINLAVDVEIWLIRISCLIEKEILGLAELSGFVASTLQHNRLAFHALKCLILIHFATPQFKNQTTNFTYRLLKFYLKIGLDLQPCKQAVSLMDFAAGKCVVMATRTLGKVIN